MIIAQNALRYSLHFLFQVQHVFCRINVIANPQHAWCHTMKSVLRIIVVLLIIGIGYVAYQRRHAANLNARGVELIDQGKYDEAIEVLQRAYSGASGNTVILRNLAFAYDNNGNFTQAREAYGTYLEMSSTDDEVKARLAFIEESEIILERAALRIVRMKEEGWRDDEVSLKKTLNAAEACFHVGNYAHAIVLNERALFKDPDNIAIESKIEMLERKVAEGKF